MSDDPRPRDIQTAGRGVSGTCSLPPWGLLGLELWVWESSAHGWRLPPRESMRSPGRVLRGEEQKAGEGTLGSARL